MIGYMRQSFYLSGGLKKTAGIIIAAAALLAAVFAGNLLVAYADVSVTWDYVYLDSSGDASWSMDVPDGEEVDKYYIQLARQKDGTWDTDYKTYKTSDSSYEINFSSKGKYYIIVRALFIGGEYSEWSYESNTVTVTSDDLSSGSGSGSSAVYISSSSSSGTLTGPLSVSSSSSSVLTGPLSVGSTSTTSTLADTLTASTESGWIKTSAGYVYRYANGTYPADTWDRIDGYWYYFNSDGIMHTGWLSLNGNWYYCLSSGRMAESSWNNINEKWYYFNESGIMQTGYITVDGNTYYTDSSGARIESAYNPDGHLFDINGVMIE